MVLSLDINPRIWNVEVRHHSGERGSVEGEHSWSVVVTGAQIADDSRPFSVPRAAAGARSIAVVVDVLPDGQVVVTEVHPITRRENAGGSTHGFCD